MLNFDFIMIIINNILRKNGSIKQKKYLKKHQKNYTFLLKILGKIIEKGVLQTSKMCITL